MMKDTLDLELELTGVIGRLDAISDITKVFAREIDRLAEENEELKKAIAELQKKKR